MKINTAITTLDDLRIEQETASMESFLGLDAVERAVQRLPGIIRGAYTLYRTHTSHFNGAKAVFLTRPMRDLYLKIEKYSYIDLRTVDVQVPEGLRADVLTYARALKQAGTVVQQLETDVLKPFETWLGQMVGNPQQLASLSNNIKIDGMRDLSFETAEKNIQGLFQTQGQRTHLVPYGQAFLRNADFKEVCAELAELETLFGQDHQKAMLDKTNRIAGLMKDLVNVLEERSKDLRVSPATVRGLADAAYHVARLLEQYGLFRYRLTEMAHAMEETRKRLDTWTKKHKA